MEAPTEHPAHLAWRALGLTSIDPTRIDILKESHKTLACRLFDCGPDGANVIAKRRATGAVDVEQRVYREVLTRFSGPSLRLLGSLAEPKTETTWLFLDDGGEVMPDFYDASHRALAGGWIGRLHTETARHHSGEGLPDQASAGALENLLEGKAGLRAARDNPQIDSDGQRMLDALITLLGTIERTWARVEGEVAGIPATIVHGDFVPKNLRLREDEQGASILPFDWETAGWGPPVVDLELVDLAAYASEARDLWKTRVGDLERLAKVGHLFRLLAAVTWEIPGLLTPWVWRPIYRLGLYLERLDVVRAELGLANGVHGGATRRFPQDYPAHR